MNDNEPFFNENRRKYARYLVWALVTLAILLSDVFGFRLPLASPGEPPAGEDDGDTKGITLAAGSTYIQGSGTIEHGLSEPSSALCALSTEPSSLTSDAAFCTVVLEGDELALYLWGTDTETMASGDGELVYWMVAGVP